MSLKPTHKRVEVTVEGRREFLYSSTIMLDVPAEWNDGKIENHAAELAQEWEADDWECMDDTEIFVQPENVYIEDDCMCLLVKDENGEWQVVEEEEVIE
jgi:hypothetical protein